MVHSIVFIGHVDSGKSTLCGQILYMTGQVSDRDIEKYKAIAQETGMTGWWISYIMDTDPNERANGKTVEVGKARFNTGSREFECIDTPGHKKYITNMIAGACFADVAVILVSAKQGEFEAGIGGGQTREHVLLAKTLGVDTVVIAINKLDTVPDPVARFNEIKGGMSKILRGSGYKPKKEVRWVGMSAYTGEGIVAGYKGISEPLFDVLNTLDIQVPDTAGRLIGLVSDSWSQSGTVVQCKIMSGTVSPGDTVRLSCVKDPLQIHSLPDSETRHPSILFKTDIHIPRGCLLLGPEGCNMSTLIDVLLITQPNCGVISVGYQCVLHMYTLEVQVIIKKIAGITTRKGQRITRQYLLHGDHARVYIELGAAYPVFNSTESTRFSRVTLRSNTDTVAIGSIIRYTGPPS